MTTAPPTLVRCTVCGRHKPPAEFWAERKRCKVCERARRRKSRAARRSTTAATAPVAAVVPEGETGPAGRAQGRRHRLAVVEAQPPASDGGFTIPPPPRRADGAQLGARTLLAWDAFWGASVARAVDLAADQRQLGQYFRDMDEIERIQAILAETPLVSGSQGQPRENPLVRREEALAARMRGTEEKFGLTPQDRERLGLVVGQAALTADELNRRLKERRV